MMQLFWVTTEDHCEDWFIIANGAEEAARFHENMEGYDAGDALAERILDIPVDISAETGSPPDEIFKALGATFTRAGSTRADEIAGKKYCEGLLEATIRSLDDDVFESLGQGRVNETTKDSQH